MPAIHNVETNFAIGNNLHDEGVAVPEVPPALTKGGIAAYLVALIGRLAHRLIIVEARLFKGMQTRFDVFGYPAVPVRGNRPRRAGAAAGRA